MPLSFPTPLGVSFEQPTESTPSGVETGPAWLVDHRETGRRLGDLAIVVVARTRAGARWVVRVAADRAVSPNSVVGIGFLLGLCAAAWFSGGTRPDLVRGLAALGAWVLARVGARYLAVATGLRARQSGIEQGEHGFGWLFAVTTTATECAVYGGIAAGAQKAGWPGTWSLAVVTVILASVAGLGRACAARGRSDPGPAAKSGQRGRGQESSQARTVRSKLGSLASPPAAVKVLLAGLLTVNYGPRIGLFSVSVIESMSLITSMAQMTARLHWPTGAAMGSAWQDLLITCRDDGPVARRTGRLVRGNLMPVPPTLAGLAAIGMLAMIGMRNPSGIVALAPVVVLLLAAPGSSHPHDGRFDWVAPVLLCLSQYGYLAVLGVGRSVAWPIIFATCSMTAIWYTSLVAGQGKRLSAKTSRTRVKATVGRGQRIKQIMARRGEGIGWEGRVSLVCLASMFGIATFGYLGLTVFLAVLLCRKAVLGYLIPREDRRR